MKLISDGLINDVQVLIDNAIHLRNSWSQVAEVKRALQGLEDAEAAEVADEDGGGNE